MLQFGEPWQMIDARAFSFHFVDRAEARFVKSWLSSSIKRSISRAGRSWLKTDDCSRFSGFNLSEDSAEALQGLRASCDLWLFTKF